MILIRYKTRQYKDKKLDEELTLKKNIVKVNKQRCKNCELCLPECKPQIIAVSNETNSMGYHPIYITEMDKCIGCTLCAVTCPEGAIEVFREEDQE